MPLYFAYGANMSHEIFSRRVGDTRSLGVAYLENYRLIFPRYSIKKKVEKDARHQWKIADDGLASSVHLSPGSRVYGILYELSDAQLVMLDEFENGAAECGKVIRFAGGDYVSVHDALFVQPLGPGVHHVMTDRHETGRLPAFQRIRAAEHPSTVADRGENLLRFGSLPDEPDHRFIPPHEVRTPSSGDHDSVKVGSVGLT